MKISFPKNRNTSFYLSIIGGVIVFLSWIAESAIQYQWKDKKEEYLQLLINVSFRQNQRLTTEFAYYEEIEKDYANPDLTAFYQQAIIDSYLGILELYNQKDLIKYEEFRKYDKMQRITLSRSKNDYSKINMLYNQVHTVFFKNFKRFQYQFINRYQEIQKEEARWNRIFIFLYVFGSMFIGSSYIIKHYNSEHLDHFNRNKN